MLTYDEPHKIPPGKYVHMVIKDFSDKQKASA